MVAFVVSRIGTSLQLLRLFRLIIKGLLRWPKNPKCHKRTKHINMKFHWALEIIERGVLLLAFLTPPVHVCGCSYLNLS